MTIQQAADKWGFSVNWVRALVKAGTVKAELRQDPVPHYWIKDSHPVPARARRSLKAEAAQAAEAELAAQAAKVAARRAAKAKGAKAPKAKAVRRAAKAAKRA